MKLTSQFIIGLALILTTKLAPLCIAACPISPSAAQQALVDHWNDSDYRLHCERPANTILIPAAQPDIEGRAGLVTLSSSDFLGTVRAFQAPKGADGALVEYLTQELNDIDAGDDFEFRELPIGKVEADQRLGELVPFLGEQALCIRLLDERPGVQLVREMRVIVRNGTALRFTVSGPLQRIHEDGRGFEPFFSAFRLSDGAFKHRADPPTTLDFDGPGYRMRGGVLESGELGLRFETPKGWRAESRPLAMDWSFASHAHFVSPGAEARITVGTKVGLIGEHDRGGISPLHGTALNFAGQQVLVDEIFPSGKRGRLRVQEGVLGAPNGREDIAEASFQLVLNRQRIQSLGPEIKRALAGATRINAVDSAAILAQTTGPNDPQVGLGEQAWLRNGTYYNGILGLRWTPPSGTWIHLVDPSKQYGMNRNTLLMSYCHARNLIYELRAKTTHSKNIERAHRLGLQSTLRVSRAKVRDIEMKEGEFLGHRAMRTRGQNLLGTGVLDFTTILLDGHAVHISVSSPIEWADEASTDFHGELQTIRDALILDPELKAAQTTENRYVNRQFGFSVDLGHESWTIQPQEDRENPDPLRASIQCMRDDGLTMTVSARWVDPIGYLDDPVHSRHRGFYNTARGLLLQDGTIKAAPDLPYQGKTIQVIRSHEEGIDWETAVIQRGPFVYTITVWNTENPKGGQISEVLDRVLLD